VVSFGTDGTARTMTVQLTPTELGRVQISVASDAAGHASVQVIAERPETLALLQHDQPELSRALDQAGIPAAGRSVSFQLAGASPAEATTSGGGTTGQGQNGFAQTGSDQPGAQPAASQAGGSAFAAAQATATATPPAAPVPFAGISYAAGPTPHAASPDGSFGPTASGQDGGSFPSGGQTRGESASPSGDVSLSEDMDEAADARPVWASSGLDIMA